MTNGQPIQDIAHPQLSWDHSWSHDWNKGMLSLLAQKFIADIKDGTRPLLPAYAQTSQKNIALLTTYVSTLTPPTVRRFIEDKLKRTQAAYRLKRKAPSEDVFRVQLSNKKRITAIADRHGSRRQLVGGYLSRQMTMFNLLCLSFISGVAKLFRNETQIQSPGKQFKKLSTCSRLKV